MRAGIRKRFATACAVGSSPAAIRAWTTSAVEFASGVAPGPGWNENPFASCDRCKYSIPCRIDRPRCASIATSAWMSIAVVFVSPLPAAVVPSNDHEPSAICRSVDGGEHDTRRIVADRAEGERYQCSVVQTGPVHVGRRVVALQRRPIESIPAKVVGSCPAATAARASLAAAPAPDSAYALPFACR